MLHFNTKGITVAKRLILQVWKSSSTLDMLSWQIGLSGLAANGKVTFKNRDNLDDVKDIWYPFLEM